MRQHRDRKFFGYVKVELRSRSPRLWAWSIHRDTTDLVLVTSDCPFFHAEDAWSAGSYVLASLEQGIPVEGIRTLEEAV
jgi:hypothetical protein